MDTRSGELYPSREAALAAGVPEAHLVEISGRPEAVAELQGTYARLRAALEEHERAKK